MTEGGLQRLVLEPGLLPGWRVDQERRGLMASTIRRRADSLKLWGHWLGERGTLEATPEDVNSFLDERRLSARGRYVWISTLHVFYTWARREGLVPVDPTEDVVRPRLRRRLPRPIGDEDLAVALELADTTRRAVLLFAALAGLRCAEIAALERHDVDEVNRTIRVVHGKGDKERVVPMHPDLVAKLALLPRRGHLIRRDDGGPFTPVQLSQHMNKYLRSLGIAATLHQVRHWFGTNTYRVSRDVLVLQELMGHASPSITAGYVLVAGIDGRDAIDALPALRSRAGRWRRFQVERAERTGGACGDGGDLPGHRFVKAGEHQAADEADEGDRAEQDG